MLRRLLALVAVMISAWAVVGLAYGAGGPGGTADQAKAAGWNCSPEVPIAGNYPHCAPPGKPSVADILAGNTNAPSIELRVFDFDTGVFAGVESLIRADLYRGQVCPQDNLTEWTLLPLPVPYRDCHHFDAWNVGRGGRWARGKGPGAPPRIRLRGRLSEPPTTSRPPRSEP